MKLLNQLPDTVNKNGWPWNIESAQPERPLIKYPKITIITPSYNQGKFIEETIRSIILQNYPELEYIIIDGGSNDQTVEIIKKYEKWITFWTSEKDNGQSHAINKGFKKATGEIINWINSDDILEINALYKIAHLFIQNKDFAFIYGQTLQFDENGYLPFQHWETDKLPLRYFYEFPYGQPSSFYKTQCIKEIGYLDEDFQYTMDLDLFIRIALNYQMLQTDDIFCHYRWHNQCKGKTLMHVATHEKKIVFSILINSLHFTEAKELLKKLDLFIDTDKIYKITNNFVHQNKYEILFEYLMPYIIRYNIENKFYNIKLIITFFKKFNPHLLKDKRLNRLKIILKMPQKLIEVFRNLKKRCKYLN